MGGAIDTDGYEARRESCRFEQLLLQKSTDGLEGLETLNLHHCELHSAASATALGRLIGDRCMSLQTLNLEGNCLGMPGVLDAFGMGIGYGGLPKLKLLVLSDCELETVEAGEALGHVLGETCPHLESLELQGNSFSDPNVLSALVRTLGQHSPKRLTKLNLERCGIDNACAATALGNMLQAMSTVQTLNLTGNHLGYDGVIEALFYGLGEQRLPNLKSLDLKRCGVYSTDSARAFGQLLGTKCSELEYVNIGTGLFLGAPLCSTNSHVPQGVLQGLEAGFGAHRLVELKEFLLWDCEIGSVEEAFSLGRILVQRCPGLKTLNLAGSHLGSAQLLDALADGLGDGLPGLEVLWLEQCGLASAAVANALGRIISLKFPGLVDLRLSHNDLGGTGILVILGAALGERGLPLLERLDLRSNGVESTEAGVRRLLPSCPSLRDVWGCRHVTNAYR